jgi:4'-phosphopantetheinyl transferase
VLETTEHVRVWRVDVRRAAAWAESASIRLLQPEERERAERGTPDVRRRRLVSRAALRVALGSWLERPPASIRFSSDRYGKPTIAGSDAHFSVSTSGDCCLVAVSGRGPIGVDVEAVVPLPELDDLVASRFAPAEAAAIVRLPRESRLRAFYNCWTRKEACLKATGVGLAEGLDRVAVTVDDERPTIVSLDGDDPAAWRLAAVDAGPGLVGAVAVRAAGT